MVRLYRKWITICNNAVVEWAIFVKFSFINEMPDRGEC